MELYSTVYQIIVEKVVAVYNMFHAMKVFVFDSHDDIILTLTKLS